MHRLEGLLDQAGIWSQTLVEQIGSMADTGAAGEASAAAHAAGSKRKAGKQGKRAAKKGAAAAAAPLDADVKVGYHSAMPHVRNITFSLAVVNGSG